MSRLCAHAHPRGFVTNQDPNQPVDLHRDHASRYVCHRPECVEAVKGWVTRQTGEPAEFYPFGKYPRGGAA